MTVMKIQVNMKVNREVNCSVSFEHVVNSEEDAKAMGAEDKRLFDAWISGYGD